MRGIASIDKQRHSGKAKPYRTSGGRAANDTMDIEGRRVLITGASRGLGRALAFAFAETGASEVLAGARKAQDIERLGSDAQALGAPITPIKLDVTNDEDIHAVAALGFVDILVNNAGVASYGDPLQMSFADAAAEMNVNYFGA